MIAPPTHATHTGWATPSTTPQPSCTRRYPSHGHLSVRGDSSSKQDSDPQAPVRQISFRECGPHILITRECLPSAPHTAHVRSPQRRTQPMAVALTCTHHTFRIVLASRATGVAKVYSCAIHLCGQRPHRTLSSVLDSPTTPTHDLLARTPALRFSSSSGHGRTWRIPTCVSVAPTCANTVVWVAPN